MAKPLRPFVRKGGYYPSQKYTPLVYPGGYTTMNSAKGKPDPLNTFAGKIVEFISKRSLPMVKLEANFTPIQDLNGQEAPWPAGGGGNVYMPQTKEPGYIDSSGNVQQPTSDQFCHSDYIPVDGTAMMWSGISGVGGNYKRLHCYDSSKNWLGNPYSTSATELGGRYSLGGSMPTGTRYIMLSFAFSDTEVKLEYGTVVTPWENICPISGHTGCDVVRTGKNLFDKNATFVDHKYIGADGSIVDHNYYSYCSDYIRVKAGTSYVFSGNIVNSGIYNSVAFYDSNKDFISRFRPTNGGEDAKFTTPANCAFLRFNAQNQEGDVFDANTIQLEEGTVATDYEPYSGTTVAISFGTTVYGGKLTVNEDGSGQIDVDRAYKAFSDITGWQYRSNQFDVSIADGKPQSESGKPSAFITDTYETKLSGASGSYPNDTCAWQGTSANQVLLLRVRELSFTSVSDFLAARGNAHICYELATPVTIPLTASQINTLVGENVVWVNDSDYIQVTAYGTAIE